MKNVFTFLTAIFSFAFYSPALNAGDFSSVNMNTGWVIFSSQNITAAGNTISKPGFLLSNSYKTDIPKTVLAALVENGIYKDPYFGMNLSKIPKEPFQFPWWYA